jgi:hypothetical protein
MKMTGMKFIYYSIFLNSKILIIPIMAISIIFIPIYGQTKWYDEWADMQSKNGPNLLDKDFVALPI